jgi:nucleoid-associated protein YgaU
MQRSWYIVLGLLILAVSVLAGCGPNVAKRIDEARAAVEEARAAGVPARFPEQFQAAEENLRESERLLASGDFDELIVAESHAAIATASARSGMTSARLAADLEKVQAEAQAAKQEAARTRAEVDRLQTQVRSAEETARVAQVRAERAESQTAELKRQMPAPKPAASWATYARYVVKQGDTLPKIAARPEIYGDADQWSRLYEANRDIIGKDRKVKMGQVLVVPKP